VENGQLIIDQDIWLVYNETDHARVDILDLYEWPDQKLFISTRVLL